MIQSGMKVLVCVSRHFNDYDLLEKTLDGLDITSIIHGAARGADQMAGLYARARQIPCEVFHAEWDKHGRAAGPIRNIRMLKEGTPVFVVAFIAPNSRGTRHMVEIAKKAGIPVKEIQI